MARSKLQRIAQERNSAKWQLMGVRGNLANLGNIHHKLITPTEQEKLSRACEAIDDILHWWNNSNTEFGLKNPDSTREPTEAEAHFIPKED